MKTEAAEVGCTRLKTMFNGAKRMDCNEIREILSDLIDVRNGEIPPVGASRMSEPEVRADAESHLASCSDCRGELLILEEVGAVFADFNVGEVSVQHFANYGEIVRAKMAAEKQRKIVPIQAGRFSRFARIGAVASLAACAAFAFLQLNPKKSHPSRTVAAASPKFIENTPIPRSTLPTAMNVFNNDLMPVKAWVYNPEETRLMAQHDEKTPTGDMVVGEKVAQGEMPLLGVLLQPTSDPETGAAPKDSLGIKVFGSVPDSVANEMGLRRDDSIVCINGMHVNTGTWEDVGRFITVVHNLGKGAVITLDIVRGDKSGVLYIQRRAVLGQPKAFFE